MEKIVNKKQINDSHVKFKKSIISLVKRICEINMYRLMVTVKLMHL